MGGGVKVGVVAYRYDYHPYVRNIVKVVPGTKLESVDFEYRIKKLAGGLFNPVRIYGLKSVELLEDQ